MNNSDISTSRFEVLTSFEKSMRGILRERHKSSVENFQRDMLLVLQYVGSIKEGVFLAAEIKTAFEFFLPKIDMEWKQTNFSPLVLCTEKYARLLTEHLERQQILFDKISVMISSLDISDYAQNIKTTISSTLIPITVEFKLMKILCEIHNFLFRRDQEKLYAAIDDFLEEFNHLEDSASQPLVQLRGLIEQLKVVIDMPSDERLVKEMVEKVVSIAQNFIHKFCGE